MNNPSVPDGDRTPTGPRPPSDPRQAGPDPEVDRLGEVTLPVRRDPSSPDLDATGLTRVSLADLHSLRSMLRPTEPVQDTDELAGGPPVPVTPPARSRQAAPVDDPTATLPPQPRPATRPQPDEATRTIHRPVPAHPTDRPATTTTATTTTTTTAGDRRTARAWRNPTVRKVGRVTGRSVTALLAVAVLAATGAGWYAVQQLRANIPQTPLVNLPNTPTSVDGATNILLVGSDSRTDAQGNPLPDAVLKQLRTEATTGLNTDTIILVRVPDKGGKAAAVSIPRDVSVQIPGFQDDKINAAYAYGKNAAARQLRDSGDKNEADVEQKSDQAGRRTLAQVVQNLTGVRVDHYAEVNLLGFYELTQALGGVDVCLRHPVDDKDSGAKLPAGRQTVSGGDALSFVRQRHNLPRGDLDRIVRQQVFMAAVAGKVLSTGTLSDPGRLSSLFGALEKSVVLDSGWDVLGFAGQMQGMAAGNVQFSTIPVAEVDARNDRGQSIITVDRTAVRSYVTHLLGQDGADDPPPPPPPPTSTTQQAPAGPQTTTTAPGPDRTVVVDVRNGTTRTGLASMVLTVLQSRGYRVGGAANTAAQATSSVRTAPGEKAAGAPLATILGGLPVVADPNIPHGRIRVMLGNDFTPADAQRVLGQNGQNAPQGNGLLGPEAMDGLSGLLGPQAAPGATDTPGKPGQTTTGQGNGNGTGNGQGNGTAQAKPHTTQVAPQPAAPVTTTPAAANPAPDTDAPITAGGIPCVN